VTDEVERANLAWQEATLAIVAAKRRGECAEDIAAMALRLAELKQMYNALLDGDVKNGRSDPKHRFSTNAPL
jgi:hypothetical protein